MLALLVHLMFFASVVLVACLALSLGTRQIANWLKLTDTRQITWHHCLAMLLAIAGSGIIGQGVFALLFGQVGLAFWIARLIAWAIAGALLATGTSAATPFMPRLRSILVGVLGGILSGLAFNTALPVYGEEVARIFSALALCGTLPFAVLFPLPKKSGSRCRPCSSSRQWYDIRSSGAGNVRMPTPGRVPVVPITVQNAVKAIKDHLRNSR